MVLRNYRRSVVNFWLIEAHTTYVWFKAGGNRDNDDAENKISLLLMPSCDPSSFPSYSSSREEENTEEENMELINTGIRMVHCWWTRCFRNYSVLEW
jgi:hypothetical protein